MVYEVKQSEVTQEQWEEMKKIVRENVCWCGAELQIRTNPEKATLEVGCPVDKEHHGYVERETWTQSFRRGAVIPSFVQTAIERKMMPKDDLGRAMNLLALRYPRAIENPESAALFIMDCCRLDLDPLIQPAEAVPVPFKSRKKGKDGKDEDAWFYVAVGHSKSATVDTVIYGYFTHKDLKKAEDGRLPAAENPGNQARVRAIKKFVRHVYPECRQKMIEMSREWYQRSEGVKAAQEFIDTEYRMLSMPEGKATGEAGERAPKTKTQATKTETAPAAEEISAEEAIEGEGFHVDLTWLEESKKALKWTDDTYKTFLISKYKVSPQGTLIEMLNRLSREQAEDFTRQINARLEKQQAEDFTRQINARLEKQQASLFE